MPTASRAARAEIELGDRGIVARARPRCPRGALLALDQDIGAVGDRQRRRDVLLDEHDRDAASRGSSQQLAKTVSDHLRRQARPRARRASAAVGSTIRARAIASICRCAAGQRAGERVRCRSARIGKQGVHLADPRARARRPAGSRRRARDCRRRSCRRRRSRSAARRRGLPDHPCAGRPVMSRPASEHRAGRISAPGRRPP